MSYDSLAYTALAFSSNVHHMSGFAHCWWSCEIQAIGINDKMVYLQKPMDCSSDHPARRWQPILKCEAWAEQWYQYRYIESAVVMMQYTNAMIRLCTEIKVNNCLVHLERLPIFWSAVFLLTNGVLMKVPLSKHQTWCLSSETIRLTPDTVALQLLQTMMFFFVHAFSSRYLLSWVYSAQVSQVSPSKCLLIGKLVNTIQSFQACSQQSSFIECCFGVRIATELHASYKSIIVRSRTPPPCDYNLGLSSHWVSQTLWAALWQKQSRWSMCAWSKAWSFVTDKKMPSGLL